MLGRFLSGIHPCLPTGRQTPKRQRKKKSLVLFSLLKSFFLVKSLLAASKRKHR